MADEDRRLPAKVELGGENPFTPHQQNMMRTAVSLRHTPEGRLNYLRAVLGAENVKSITRSPLFEGSDAQEIFIRNPSVSDKFFPLDEEGITKLDITADLAGPIVQGLPTVLVGSHPAAVGAAGAAGAGLRQGLSEMLPGSSDMTMKERAVDVGMSTLFGLGGQATANTGARVFDSMRPGNILAKEVRRMEEGSFAAKGLRRSEQTGIPLTLAEETGSRSATMAEGLARRNIVTADDFFQFQQGQLRQSVSNLRGALDNVGPQRGSFEIGEAITRAFDDATEKAFELRRTQSLEDFGAVARLSQGRPVVPTNQLRNEIDVIIAELDVPGAGDATSRVVNQAKKLRDSLGDEAAPLTAEQTQRLLQIYTSAQRGTGVLFRDMDKAQSRMVASRLKDGLLRDLDSAAEAGEDAIATALRSARDNYRLNTQAITELGDSTLSRLIGNRTRSPEAIAEKFLRMKPSEVRSSMALIEKIDPQAAQSVRRSFIETAMFTAREIPASQLAANGVRFSAARFLNAMPDGETLRAAGFTRQQLVEIGQTVKMLERIADKGLEGSPTAPFMLAWDAIKGAFTLNPAALMRSAGAVITPRAIARAVLTPEGRQAIRTLSETGRGTRKTAQALLTFSAITGTDVAGTGFSRPAAAPEDIVELQ